MTLAFRSAWFSSSAWVVESPMTEALAEFVGSCGCSPDESIDTRPEDSSRFDSECIGRLGACFFRACDRVSGMVVLELMLELEGNILSKHSFVMSSSPNFLCSLKVQQQYQVSPPGKLENIMNFGPITGSDCSNFKVENVFADSLCESIFLRELLSPAFPCLTSYY
jgi:hypothetical protein